MIFCEYSDSDLIFVTIIIIIIEDLIILKLLKGRKNLLTNLDIISIK